MNRLLGAWRRLTSLWNRRKQETELEQELSAHLELAADEFERGGMSREDARRAAVLQLGGMEQTREQMRDGMGFLWLEHLRRDAALAWRGLRKAPAYALTVSGMLALSIGAGSALYSVVAAMILHPLSYPRAGELVVLKQKFSGPELSRFTSTRLIAASENAMTTMATAGMIGRDANVSGSEVEAERVMCIATHARMFQVLEAKPLLGRLLAPNDDRSGAERVLVASYAYWQTKLGGKRDAIGRTLMVDGQPHTVVGVLPKEFLLTGLELTHTEIYVAGLFDEARWKPRLPIAFGIGRLRPGAGPRQAQAELQAIANAHPPRRGGPWKVGVAPWEDDLAREARTPLALLAAVAGILFAVACVNAANLQLARGFRRQREFAVRRALGASRARVVAQLLVESVLLSLLSGLGGWALAYLGKDVLTAYLAQRLPGMPPVPLDATAFAFSLATGVLAGLIFGLWPAWHVARESGSDPLKEGLRSSHSRGARRFRNGLVAVEVGLSLAGMVAAGLLLRSLLELQRVDGGYRTAEVTVGTVDLDRARYASPEKQSDFAERVLEELRRSPGIKSAGVSSHVPLGGLVWSISDIELESQTKAIPIVFVGLCTPDYFGTVRIPVHAGRGFSAQDRRGSEEVALVDRRFAELYCKERGCVGRRFRHWSDDGRMVTIAGVVGNVRLSPSGDLQPTIYRPMAQEGMYHLEFLVRSRNPEIGAWMAAAARRVDRDQPMHGIEPMEARVAKALAPNRVMVTLVGVLGALALALGAAGVGSVLWHDLTLERRAIGIRMALGAGAGRILRQEFGRGMAVVTAGAVVGSLLAAWLVRWMKSELWGVREGDPAAWLLAWGVVLLAGAVASALPAWAGSRVQVAEVLRAE